jgi:hypothetical protein
VCAQVKPKLAGQAVVAAELELKVDALLQQ